MAQLYKKKKFTNIKGFTIVELVIVIAVIAILATVLVPTFSNVIEKANTSSDISLVRNINNVLKINSSLDDIPSNKTQVRSILRQYGIKNTKNKAKQNNIYWTKANNSFFIWNNEEQEIIYPECYKGMKLEEFDDEVNMSDDDVLNLIYDTKQISIPNTGILAYSKEPKDGWRLDSNGKRLEHASGFVTVGLIEIDVMSYDSLTIYIKGALIRNSIRESYYRMHIFKESDYKKVTEIDYLYVGLTNDYWGFEIKEIDELYYKITFDMDKLIEASTNANGEVEKVYYALSLFGRSGNLVITHNEKIKD